MQTSSANAPVKAFSKPFKSVNKNVFYYIFAKEAQHLTTSATMKIKGKSWLNLFERLHLYTNKKNVWTLKDHFYW